MKSKLPYVIFGCIFALSACGGSGADGASPPVQVPPPAPPPPPSPPPPPAPPPTSIEREIAPSLTGPGFIGSQSPHIAINPGPATAARGKLFVMLPGTFAVPRTYRLITRTAPTQGFHAIGLTYPNDEAIEGLCGSSNDPDCAGRARREVITGEDTSPLVAIDANNSIINRLRALLIYLRSNFPGEGWDQYLNGNEPVWSRITVAGHSQGGGHAGFLGKLFSLDRIAMFSSPGDTGVAPGSSAQWLTLPNITPASRQYGFTHTRDPLIPQSLATVNWGALGLGAFGGTVSVDGASLPFSNSHQLLTSAAPNPNPTGPTASPEHGAPVVDSVTPLNASGEPIFRNVWIYMAFS